MRTGAVESAGDVERVHIECVPFTYPIYKLNYLSELTRNLKALSNYPNLPARRPLRDASGKQHGPSIRQG